MHLALVLVNVVGTWRGASLDDREWAADSNQAGAAFCAGALEVQQTEIANQWQIDGSWERYHNSVSSWSWRPSSSFSVFVAQVFIQTVEVFLKC